MSRRGKVLIAAVLAALVAIAVLWWRPFDTGTKGEDRAAVAPEKPAPTSKPQEALSPPTIPGAAAAPLRLSSAETTMSEDAETGRFEGRIINWGSGAPVPGAEIVFRSAGEAVTTHSGDDGRFSFTPPRLGSLGLAMISADGFLPYAPAWGGGAIDMVARPNAVVTGLVFYLTPAITYSGLVQDKSGTPVAGADVRILSTGTGSFELAPIDDTFKSASDGTFSFSAPDFSVLEAHHQTLGVGRAELDVAVQVSHKMTIVIDVETKPMAGAIVFGVVKGPEGAAIPEALVRATIGSGAERADAEMTRPRVRTDLDGRFELAVPAKTRVLLEAVAAEFARGKVVVDAGGEGSRLETVIELGPGAGLRGKVVDETGAAVPAFSLIVTRKEGITEPVVWASSFFDASGEFEVRGLAEGDYGVRAAAYGFATSEAVSASAKAGERGDSITVTLPRGGTLVGRVLDAESKEPLAAARVSVEQSIGGGDSAQPIDSSVVTGQDGRFELAGLTPGRASIIAGAFDHHSRIVGGLLVESGGRIGPIDIELSPTKPGERPQLELAGIGAQLRAKDDGLEVQALIDGGGAIEAGIIVGDLIIAIEGEKVSELGMSRAIGMIRGPVNTPVQLVIRRAGEEQPVRALRRKIRA